MSSGDPGLGAAEAFPPASLGDACRGDGEEKSTAPVSLRAPMPRRDAPARRAPSAGARRCVGARSTGAGAGAGAGAGSSPSSENVVAEGGAAAGFAAGGGIGGARELCDAVAAEPAAAARPLCGPVGLASADTCLPRISAACDAFRQAHAIEA